MFVWIMEFVLKIYCYHIDNGWLAKYQLKKKTKCECNGKYSYTCENDLIKDWNYCSIDKGACLRMNSTEVAIKECDN